MQPDRVIRDGGRAGGRQNPKVLGIRLSRSQGYRDVVSGVIDQNIKAAEGLGYLADQPTTAAPSVMSQAKA
jgi:hypothetical protein